ncbi:MAG: hypothetical protein ACTINM_05740 [Acetobacter cibinongensis]
MSSHLTQLDASEPEANLVGREGLLPENIIGSDAQGRLRKRKS